MATAESIGNPIAVLPLLYHPLSLWRHELVTDLSVPLHEASLVTRGPVTLMGGPPPSGSRRTDPVSAARRPAPQAEVKARHIRESHYVEIKERSPSMGRLAPIPIRRAPGSIAASSQTRTSHPLRPVQTEQPF
jgi:hypothetical protein